MAEPGEATLCNFQKCHIRLVVKGNGFAYDIDVFPHGVFPMLTHWKSFSDRFDHHGEEFNALEENMIKIHAAPCWVRRW